MQNAHFQDRAIKTVNIMSIANGTTESVIIVV